jgi:hypothetical protein
VINPREALQGAMQHTRLRLALGSVCLATLLAGCGDTWGFKTEGGAQNAAVGSYDAAYAQASPAGKFTLDYLRQTEISALYDDSSEYGNSYYQFAIGSACLGGTSFDIAGGSASASASSSSLFGSSSSASAESTVPTAEATAVLDPKNKNELIIQSGGNHPKYLHFGIPKTGQQLAPLGSQTQNILVTYGCPEMSPLKEYNVNDSSVDDYGTTSPWINSGNQLTP